MRRVPSGRTRAKPFSRRTLRCWETAGWVRPNSFCMTATTSPEEWSASARSSRMRRRTGSPSTSKACTRSVALRRACVRADDTLVGTDRSSRIGATGDRGVAPGTARAGDELEGVGRLLPGVDLGAVDGFAFRDVQGETEEPEVPADTHGPGAELFPQVVRHVRDVAELELGAVIAEGPELDDHQLVSPPYSQVIS